MINERQVGTGNNIAETIKNAKTKSYIKTGTRFPSFSITCSLMDQYYHSSSVSAAAILTKQIPCHC